MIFKAKSGPREYGVSQNWNERNKPEAEDESTSELEVRDFFWKQARIGRK
jgi:hypothetical protein